MLKLMIVEDESLERKALSFLLSSHYKESLQIVCEVSNGKDAVDNAILYKPDIILMDINLPIMDGLQASSIIKSNCIDTEFIILTAFNYFDYAKKAINIGVSDYLLKPFSNEDFFNAINKLIYKLTSKVSNINSNNKLVENYKKVMPYIEKEMISNIIYGVSLTIEQYQEYRELLGISSNTYCSLVFISDSEKIFNESNLNAVKSKLNMMFSKVISCICLNNMVTFIFDKELASKLLSKKFDNLLNSIQLDFKLNKAATIYVGIGSYNTAIDKLYSSYKDAKLSSENQKYKHSNIECFPKKYAKNNIIISELEVIISGKIINEDLNGTVTELDNILENLLINNELKDFLTIKNVFIDIFNTIIENIREFLGEGFKNFSKDKTLEDLLTLKELSYLKPCINLIGKHLIDLVSAYKSSKNIVVIEKAKRYVENNYMNEISLDDLSHYVSMSSFYFSRIFTKVEGMNFRDYLVKVRMEKAKTMLLEGNKSIKQIGLEVGYTDQNYFSKAFKKFTKLSPKEYINIKYREAK